MDTGTDYLDAVAQGLPVVCSPETFLAADFPERRRWLAKQIAAHPRYHDQGSWYWRDGCGTTACAAGWAMLLAGRRSARNGLLFDDHDELMVPESDGRRLLGLTRGQAEELFYEIDDHNEVVAWLEETA